MKKKLFRFLVFLAIGVLLFCGFWKVFHFKYAKRLELFYGLPKDTVDVLVTGSSHAHVHINPAILFEENGISAYILSSSNQPIWNSYYYIVEALKTQSPKLVIVECYRVFEQEDYASDPTTIKAVSNMKLSANRTEAILNSVGDKSKLVDYFLEFPWFHSRYEEISGADFLSDYGDPNYLGFGYLKKVVKGKLPAGIGDITERRAITEKNLRYLDKIVQLSKEKHFQLLFVVTPFRKNAAEKQAYYNSLADYARENDIPFINGNLLYDEVGIDPEMDFSTGTHLSRTGAEKITRYLAKYIREHYDLEDHRGDSRYDRWEKNLQQSAEKTEERGQ